MRRAENILHSLTYAAALMALAQAAELRLHTVICHVQGHNGLNNVCVQRR